VIARRQANEYQEEGGATMETKVIGYWAATTISDGIRSSVTFLRCVPS